MPVNDEFEAKKELLSDFNEAKFQILRLHNLWQTCNILSNAGRLEEWKWKLDSIWRELTPDAREKDGYDNSSEWIKDATDKEGSYLNSVDKLNKEIANAQTTNQKYIALAKKEVFLRCLQDEVGKGSKRSFSDEDDLDE